MSELLTLEEMDRDGAIQEQVADLAGDTRAGFLRKAAVGGGAMLGGGALLGGLPSIAGASAGVAKSDVAILNFALTLEYLEAEFYTQAVAGGKLQGNVAQFAKVVKGHEVAHVAFLKSALGGAAVPKPKFDFKGATTNEAAFKKTAQILEDTGVAAYLGQVGNIKSKKILGAAGSILPVEARHAGWIRDINGVSGAPRPFEGARTKAQILAAVKGTGFIVG